MMYCQSKGVYYVQLEDDIIAKPFYVSKINEFIVQQSIKSMATPPPHEWVYLDFCALGFIGKVFKTSELPRLILFFTMFFNDKPVDWLLDHYVTNTVCPLGATAKECIKDKGKLVIVHKPSLFQHVGLHSSLRGKMQKLKDKSFNKEREFIVHKDNPKASLVSSTFPVYKKYNLKQTYEGREFYWSLQPRVNDSMLFEMEKPVNLQR